MAIVLDGKKVAGQIKADLASRVAGLARMGVVPGLGTLLVGGDPGSMKYVEGKHRDCEEVGIASIRRQLPATATTEDVLAVVRDLNEDPACTGYIIQLPLPAHIDSNAIISAIDPVKDADGMHPYNLGNWCCMFGVTSPLHCLHSPRGARPPRRLRHRTGRQERMRTRTRHHHRSHHWPDAHEERCRCHGDALSHGHPQR